MFVTHFVHSSQTNIATGFTFILWPGINCGKQWRGRYCQFDDTEDEAHSPTGAIIQMATASTTCYMQHDAVTTSAATAVDNVASRQQKWQQQRAGVD